MYTVARQPVAVLELTVRSSNALNNAGIHYIDQLRGMTEADVLRTRGIARRCLNEIKECLADHGLAFKPADPVHDLETR